MGRGPPGCGRCLPGQIWALGAVGVTRLRAGSSARRRFVELREQRELWGVSGAGGATCAGLGLGLGPTAWFGEESVGRRGRRGERPRAARLALATDDRERVRATQAEHDAQPDADAEVAGEGGAAGGGDRTTAAHASEAGAGAGTASGILCQISS